MQVTLGSGRASLQESGRLGGQGVVSAHVSVRRGRWLPKGAGVGQCLRPV